MKTGRRLFGLASLMVVAGIAACTGREKARSAEVPETVEEQTVVAYSSQTHGALQVKSVRDNPADWFVVLRDGERATPGNPPLLNRTVELAPGVYEVDVNRTRRKVTITAGEKTLLWTGELLVEGKPSSAYWYPMEGSERRLTSNPPVLDRPVALFRGTYTVFVHVSVTMADKHLGTAEVHAGRRTVLQHR